MPLTISLAMIVAEADADLLAGAINSAKGLVDQVVVVVDPASVKAKAAAVAAGADVHMFTWCDNFAAARNAALDCCTGDWVLVLDADETLEVNDADFRDVLSRRPAIYNLTVSSALDGGRVVTNDTPRLFPRQPSIRYEGAIHETPVDANELLSPEAFPALALAHVGYSSDAMERAGKFDRNIGILTNEIANDPINPQLRLYLAQVLHQVDPDAAADQLRLALYFCRIFPMADAAGCYDQAAADLLSALSAGENYQRALVEARLVIEHRHPEHAGFWVNLANCQMQCGAYHLSAASSLKAMACSGLKTQQMDRSAVTWLPEAMLGMAMVNLGRNDEAFALLARALAMNPEHNREVIQAHYDKLLAARNAAS
jgi:tetratricopeptide (TPR) repeat protein